MNISFLIQMLQNKITALTNAKSQAVSIGDFEQVAVIEKELLDTQNTFSQLAMLSDMTTAANNANTTPAEIISAGLDKIQNTIVESPIVIVGPSAEAIVNGYDISAYATDPMHEQKIQGIVNGMPDLTLASDIDTYMKNIAPETPLSGDMIITASNIHQIDIPLLIAIMQNDSSFGTTGIGARTNNPGNVGNNGVSEQAYPSWQDGVNAVAQWLVRHKILQKESTAIEQNEDIVEQKISASKKRKSIV